MDTSEDSKGIDLSPAQLLLGRRPRNTLPAASSLLVSKSYSNTTVKEYFNFAKNKQKFYHDRPTTKKYSLLKPDKPVRIVPFPNTKQWIPGIIKEKLAYFRHFIFMDHFLLFRMYLITIHIIS